MDICMSTKNAPLFATMPGSAYHKVALKVAEWLSVVPECKFYHSRQPRLPLELSHWLRAVEYLRCYPRVLNLGYLSSNILYLQRSKYQIQKKEVRQPLSHPCSHVVFQEIFVTEATQGLSQNSKTAWINNQARTKVHSHTLDLPRL